MLTFLLFQIFDMLSPQFWEKAVSPEKLFQYSASLVRVAIVLTLAWIASGIVKRFVRKIHEYTLKAMNTNQQDSGESAKRAATLSGLFRRTVTSLIWAVAIITSLQQAGFDIAPILATAGVAGLAVSFGAQNLVRDVFSGAFLLIEDQIRVGDVAEINGTGGSVEQINLRTTRLRSLDGTVHIFPNGTITKLSNLTQEFSYYVWDLGIGYADDTDQAVEAVRELADRMREEPKYRAMILEPLEVLGVDQFGADAVILKMRIKTKPIQQWTVGRELNRRIKKRFDELGIDIPVPQRALQLGRGVAQALAGAGGGAMDRAAIKEIVREVVAEIRAADGGARDTASPA